MSGIIFASHCGNAKLVLLSQSGGALSIRLLSICQHEGEVCDNDCGVESVNVRFESSSVKSACFSSTFLPMEQAKKED